MAEIRLHTYLRIAEGRLTEAGIDNPRLDAALLVGYGLGLDRAQLLSQSERMLTGPEMAHADRLIERRLAREPVARILGLREFWSLNFALNEATLEPRPDSETLIEAALLHIKRAGRQNETLRILDLGTGSGCLLIALLHELKHATGMGIDSAPRAVEQATSNAQNNGVVPRAVFRAGDWFAGIDGAFDIIISNPPYIRRDELAKLQPEVFDFDPTAALDGGADGLEAYRTLIPQLQVRLMPNGFALFEIGHDQAKAVTTLFHAAGFQYVTVMRDYGGNERCILALAG